MTSADSSKTVAGGGFALPADRRVESLQVARLRHQTTGDGSRLQP